MIHINTNKNNFKRSITESFGKTTDKLLDSVEIGNKNETQELIDLQTKIDAAFDFILNLKNLNVTFLQDVPERRFMTFKLIVLNNKDYNKHLKLEFLPNTPKNKLNSVKHLSLITNRSYNELSEPAQALMVSEFARFEDTIGEIIGENKNTTIESNEDGPKFDLSVHKEYLESMDATRKLMGNDISLNKSFAKSQIQFYLDFCPTQNSELKKYSSITDFDSISYALSFTVACEHYCCEKNQDNISISQISEYIKLCFSVIYSKSGGYAEKLKRIENDMFFEKVIGENYNRTYFSPEEKIIEVARIQNTENNPTVFAQNILNSLVGCSKEQLDYIWLTYPKQIKNAGSKRGKMILDQMLELDEKLNPVINKSEQRQKTEDRSESETSAKWQSKIDQAFEYIRNTPDNLRSALKYSLSVSSQKELRLSYQAFVLQLPALVDMNNNLSRTQNINALNSSIIMKAHSIFIKLDKVEQDFIMRQYSGFKMAIMEPEVPEIEVVQKQIPLILPTNNLDINQTLELRPDSEHNVISKQVRSETTVINNSEPAKKLENFRARVFGEPEAFANLIPEVFVLGINKTITQEELKLHIEVEEKRSQNIDLLEGLRLLEFIKSAEDEPRNVTSEEITILHDLHQKNIFPPPLQFKLTKIFETFKKLTTKRIVFEGKQKTLQANVIEQQIRELNESAMRHQQSAMDNMASAAALRSRLEILKSSVVVEPLILTRSESTIFNTPHQVIPTNLDIVPHISEPLEDEIVNIVELSETEKRTLLIKQFVNNFEDYLDSVGTSIIIEQLLEEIHLFDLSNLITTPDFFKHIFDKFEFQDLSEKSAVIGELIRKCTEAQVRVFSNIRSSETSKSSEEEEDELLETEIAGIKFASCFNNSEKFKKQLNNNNLNNVQLAKLKGLVDVINQFYIQFKSENKLTDSFYDSFINKYVGDSGSDISSGSLGDDAEYFNKSKLKRESPVISGKIVCATYKLSDGRLATRVYLRKTEDNRIELLAIDESFSHIKKGN